MIYLDNCATTRAFDEAVSASARFQAECYYNASAPYSAALSAEKEMKKAAAVLAASVGLRAEEVFFTSGGTESDNWAIFGAAAARGAGRIICSAGEHPAVYEAVMHLKQAGYDTAVAPLRPDGCVDEQALLSLVTENTVLVSVMHVNNETGALNDIAALAKRVKEINPACLFHSDGVQAHMRVPLKLSETKVDLYSASAHKVHGGKGVGCLFVKKEVRLKPLLYGGGQQNGLRSGTLNLPGIAAYAEAVRKFEEEKIAQRIAKVLQVYRRRLGLIGVIHGREEASAGHMLAVGFEGVQASTLQNALEEQGVIVGKGSACSSRNARISRVLEEMRVPQSLAAGTVRIGVGAFNTEQEAEQACEIIEQTVGRLKKFRRK